ncbi:type II toxin-antitoxin system prevent-host-death family antitoxin [Sphingomonas nostoxanthinifaciens]|uniref:type II toxin-antitoxin system prevent-host-death family antitoxin n=1 Tax=Sphingomonas nostoxanthinifaciens TaxID=2872652 RepID=UPI001CC1C797|nr:type II toxin-antitoxin system prevent-host-death family antitoxin [Sphingomonas nostoxanthinifaciens]UAK24415.1 type II toxin-antitoxin system prevent-host-death family antitoxin [Sphingomonas nostoxanthinifaciens]
MDTVDQANAKARLNELADRAVASGPIDITRLRSLTATMQFRPQGAADLVRMMRDSERY